MRTLTERVEATAAARAALEQRFVDEVDPDRVLPEEERDRLVAEARRAHYVAVAAKRLATQARKRAEEQEQDNGGTTGATSDTPERGSGVAEKEG
jgi:hypothetical protein